MALTRADAESELVLRCGRLLAVAGLDGTTVDGTNAALNGPLRAGLESLGIAPAAFAVADADLGAVAAADVPQLLDVAELRALRNVLGNLDEPDQQQGQDYQLLDKMAQRVAASVAELADRCERRYGLTTAPAVCGTIELGFQEPEDAASFPAWYRWWGRC